MSYQSRLFGTPGRLSNSGYAKDITSLAPSVHERYATSLSRFEPVKEQEQIPIGRFLLGFMNNLYNDRSGDPTTEKNENNNQFSGFTASLFRR